MEGPVHISRLSRFCRFSAPVPSFRGLTAPALYHSVHLERPVSHATRRDDSHIQGVPRRAAYPPQNAAPRMPATSHQIGSPTPIVSAKPTMKPSAAESKVLRTLRRSVPVVVEPKSIRHRIGLPARNEGGSPCRLLPFDKCPANGDTLCRPPRCPGRSPSTRTRAQVPWAPCGRSQRPRTDPAQSVVEPPSSGRASPCTDR
jgi:hypothetical protein